MNLLTRKSVMCNKRNLWEWINIMFNKVDGERLKLYGPDRTCAEWLLRNGACVKWVGHPTLLRNYNRLPPEGTILHIEEVDATGSSINHYGFPHFKDCNHITSLILHECSQVEDKAFEYLHYLDKSLIHLQVSSCNNVTGKGLMHITNLSNLKKLVLFDLRYVKKDDLDKLKEKLNCTIEFK